MPFYLLDTRQLWGDYGDHLINATASRVVWHVTPLELNRIGPFVPPLFSCATNFLVTDDIKRRIESEKPFPVDFRPTSYKNIHRLDWHKWDLDAPEPRRYPVTHEPEDYFEEVAPPSWWPRWAHQISSQQIAKTMPPSWELVPPIKPCRVKWLGYTGLKEFGHTHSISFDQTPHEGLFYSSVKCLYTVLDEPARRWLAKALGEWVHFNPLRLD